MICYLPSCAFTAKHQETAARLGAWLEKKGVRVCGCCKECGGSFGAGDTVLFNCMSCMLTAEENSPLAAVKSVYGFLTEQPDFPWPDLGGERIAVQDCFRAREHAGVRAAVRGMLRRMNAAVVELPDRGETCTFDGVFLMNPLPARTVAAAPKACAKLQRFVTPLPEAEQLERMREHAAAIGPVRVAAYCNGCLAGLKKGGADAVHVLDLACARL